MKQKESSEIDAIDRRILRAVQQNGRISNADLARTVNLSPTACHERLKRLQRDGVITGFTARLNPDRLGMSMIVFVEVWLDRVDPHVFEAFASAIKAMPEVMECHMVAGGFDYLVKARVRDMAAYRDFLGNALLSLPGVRQTHTYAVMEEVKAETALPV